MIIGNYSIGIAMIKKLPTMAVLAQNLTVTVLSRSHSSNQNSLV